MATSPDERDEDPIARLHEEARTDDELIARLREDVRNVGAATPVEDNAPVGLERVGDPEGSQEP